MSGRRSGRLRVLSQLRTIVKGWCSALYYNIYASSTIFSVFVVLLCRVAEQACIEWAGARPMTWYMVSCDFRICR